MSTKLIAITGPTGTGKSELSLQIAEHLIAHGQPAEIINCDSMQFYQGMDIGTAKLSQAERRGIRHHLIDHLPITTEVSVADYQTDARAIIENLQDRGIRPILVGGSMLYLAAVINAFEFPGTNPEIRDALEARALEIGSVALHRELALLDPIAASRVDPLNPRRVIRAIEIIKITGQPFSAMLPDEPVEWQPSTQIGLRAPRELLIERLKLRVRKMWQQGLVDEVRELTGRGLREARTASRAIGYAQALAQLDGLISETAAIDDTVRLTQKYARRQMSWLNRDKRINWLQFDDPQLLQHALDSIE